MPGQEAQPFDIQKAIQSAAKLHRQGALEDAERLYNAVLKVEPSYFDALHLLGVLQGQRDKPNIAVDLITLALRYNPDSAEAHSNLGYALMALNRYADAVENFDKALAIKPNDAAALVNRGTALAKLRRHEEAIASFDKALVIEPNAADTLRNQGNSLRELGRDEAAIASYDKVLRINPEDAVALNNRASALAKLRRFEEAIASYEKALVIRPTYEYAFGRAALCRAYICDWENRGGIEERLVTDVRVEKSVINPFAFLAFSQNPADQLSCASRMVQERWPALSLPGGQVHYRHDTIRVAYVSADFHDHATARLIAGLFEGHDRTRFQIVGVSFGPNKSSEMRNRLIAAFDRFIDVRGIGDARVAGLLREEEVDIAVDLKGFTTDCRPGIFSYHAAPTQVSYLGHPGTMGAPYIDYIIADEFVIPREDQNYYAEKVVYLPECYQVNDAQRHITERTPSRAEVGLPEQGFVFCCFNNTYKITPPVFDVWMRLLREVGGSVLWLLEANPTAASNLRREAQARGVDPNRLILAPRLKLADHLARHRLADLFLDTLPVNAHTTASDALWTGLPVLTCMATTFSGRVAASLLQAIGLPELITHSMQEYEALALKLAREPVVLKETKDKLVRNRLTKPLFDTDRFRRHIETAYTTMWEIHQRGEEPRSFAVPPFS